MQRILITGGNEGIGYYMVLQFLEAGNQVAVLDIHTDKLLTLKETYGDNLLPFVCDISQPKIVQQCADTAAAAFGGIDLAVHNACKCLFTSLEDTTDEDYKDVLAVNFHGGINLTRAVLPHMKKQGQGRIFFTSSGVGLMGFGNISAYASSKGPLEALAKCLNLEYTDTGISFHILHPPLTKTTSASPLPVPDAFKADPEQVGRGLAKRINQKRFVICHSPGQTLQTRMAYLIPVRLGRLMNKMTARTGNAEKK